MYPLLLFQFAVTKEHPVQAASVVEVLNSLGLLDAVKANPSRAAIIFVVPTDIARDFEWQPIQTVDIGGPVE